MNLREIKVINFYYLFSNLMRINIYCCLMFKYKYLLLDMFIYCYLGVEGKVKLDFSGDKDFFFYGILVFLNDEGW